MRPNPYSRGATRVSQKVHALCQHHKNLIKTLLSLILCLATISGAGSIVTTNITSQIVTCQENVNVTNLMKEYALTPTFVYKYSLNGFAAPMDAATATKLKQDSRILFVEADGPVQLCDQTNSTGFARMGIARFPVAHIDGTNHPLNVGVAILDTGIDPTHTDLNIFTNISPISLSGQDWNGHGTEVAGVLCAQDNGFGVVGIAPGIQLWNIQCIGQPPFNTWSYIVSGMNYCIANSNQIAVVNMSFVNAKGSSAPYSTVHQAIKNIVARGILVVAGDWQ